MSTPSYQSDHEAASRLNASLATAYEPGALYAINTNDEWHIAAFSGEAFHAVKYRRQRWAPLAIDRAVLLAHR